jgi:cysteine desulfurase
MGALTHGNVRVSLSGDATEQTVDALVAATAETVRSLRAEVGL